MKQLHPELAMDDDFRAMFEDEARVATRLHHDNVVETYDIYSDVDVCPRHGVLGWTDPLALFASARARWERGPDREDPWGL